MGPLLALVLSVAQAPSELTIEAPILCTEVRGLEDFTPRPRPALPRGEKFRLYQRIEGQSSRTDEGKSKVHLVEGLKLRKKGQTRTVLANKKAVEFRESFEGEPGGVYLVAVMETKTLAVGPYELDLTLRDEVSGQTAKRTFAFEVTEPKEEDGGAWGDKGGEEFGKLEGKRLTGGFSLASWRLAQAIVPGGNHADHWPVPVPGTGVTSVLASRLAPRAEAEGLFLGGAAQSSRMSQNG